MTTTGPTNTPAALMDEFARRAAAGDGAGLLDLYAPEAAFQPEEGLTLVGHDQIGPAIAELAAMHPTITYTDEPDVVIVGDIALVSNRWTMEATAPDGSRVRQGGISADVVRRDADGRWRVLVDQPRGEDLAP